MKGNTDAYGGRSSVWYSGASAFDLVMKAAWASSSSAGGGSVHDVDGLTDLGEELLLSGRGAKAEQANRPGRGVSEAIRCVGGHVHGFPGLGDQLLASEAELHLTFEHREHLLEVVTVGGGPPPGGTCMSMSVYFPAVSSPLTRTV